MTARMKKVLGREKAVFIITEEHYLMILQSTLNGKVPISTIIDIRFFPELDLCIYY